MKLITEADRAGLQDLLARLDCRRPLASGNYMAECPVCGNDGLIVIPKSGGFACKCNAGCEPDLILAVIDRRRPRTAQPQEWEPIIPFGEASLPPFPVEVLPTWIRTFVEAEAARTQTPPDLAGMLTLAVIATVVATTHEINAGPGWNEPLNGYFLVALPPGSRKSAIFTSVTKPLIDYERETNKDRAADIAFEKTHREILAGRLEMFKKEAIRKKSEEERDYTTDDAWKLAQELEALQPMVSLRLLADDCTPEKLAGLMAEQGGRIAILSAEGGVFDIIAGRYSDKMPNLDIYLKAHNGDNLRVDRMGRTTEYIERPALTLGLAVQPEVLRGLASRPGFRGRGLLGRFLFSLPASNIGYRQIQTPATPPEIIGAYREGILRLLNLTPCRAEDGAPYPKTLCFEPPADQIFQEFATGIEAKLCPDGELSSLTDWGAKLTGATARLAGLLHLAEHGDTRREVSADIISRACVLGKYLVEQAKAAYEMMGMDTDTEAARVVLMWIQRKRLEQFTKREAFNALRGRFKRAEELDKPLMMLAERGYLRQEAAGEPLGKGRPSGPAFKVSPLLDQSAETRLNTPGR